MSNGSPIQFAHPPIKILTCLTVSLLVFLALSDFILFEVVKCCHVPRLQKRLCEYVIITDRNDGQSYENKAHVENKKNDLLCFWLVETESSGQTENIFVHNAWHNLTLYFPLYTAQL